MSKKFIRSFISLLTIFCIAFSFVGCSSVIEDVLEIMDETEETEIEEVEISDDSSEDTEENETSVTEESTTASSEDEEIATDTEEASIDINGVYTTMEDVALYIYTYGCLPNNFITKSEARALGWEGGSLEPYAPGMCIGGDYFGNYEERLPVVAGREYHECDINTLGASSRGAERIIYSSDGQIYYTADHYETFTLIYGEE